MSLNTPEHLQSVEVRPSLDGPDTEEDNLSGIDPAMRLRTVRTAASAQMEAALSEARAQKRESLRKKRSLFFKRGSGRKRLRSVSIASVSTTGESSPGAVKEVPGLRRNIYVNQTPSAAELDQEGEPKARYVRNKVRTSKYTIFTFIPKNLYEQFRRVANLYFLALVVVQAFPVFGATSSSIASLPLIFILAVTAIKDGIEDYRRATLDEEVNTSAATKLAGAWRNVNHPKDPRSRFEKMLGLNKPGTVTKGVRKLREKEAGDGMRIMLTRAGENGDEASVRTTTANPNPSSFSLSAGTTAGQSMESHSYPPVSLPGEMTSKFSMSDAGSNLAKPSTDIGRFGSFSEYMQSSHSQSTIGVVDWRKRTGGSARWERTLWKKLEVGDIVLLRDNEQVPADIVVLSTSDSDGMCFVETKNLDGETNLKPRKALRATSSIASEDDIERSSFVLDSEPGHKDLYVYHGILRYRDLLTGEERQDTVTINELLLRGCSIRNTAWIIGLVVFTGADTKIMLNGGETPSKRSKIERETNFNVVVNFIVLVGMCAVAGIVNGLWSSKRSTSADFYEIDAEPSASSVLNGIVTFVSCLVAFQNIVPISLYISIEIVKTIQAYFISQDVDMYYQPYDTPCVPKTWNISDDLGQIEYIFSDKTGTLTQNVMEFQKCSVSGVVYGEGVTEAQKGAAFRAGQSLGSPEEMESKLALMKQEMIGKMEGAFGNRYLQRERLTLVSPKLADDLVGGAGEEQRERLIGFFRALALCHSVLADRPGGKEDPFLVEYKAESPDEAALVAAARDVGFPFLGKSKDTLEIEVMGAVEKYVLLKVLEFNSTRKRMSVIVRTPKGELILYTKGADSVIYERLAKDHDVSLRDQTAKDMEGFANSGLRTLCVASRPLSEEEYATFARTYDAATNAIKDRDVEINNANALIEHSLHILGATALEDKLQEGVPEAIETLHQAGIKLWILTGDKLQTAIEIGYSCNLLKTDMDLMILSAGSGAEARMQIEAGLNKIASVLGPPSGERKKRGFVPGKQAAFAVVIDGDTLKHALGGELRALFLTLGTQCETVVCCRVSPAQKAEVVKLVKEGRDAMTLSIGDGANDVAMIQEANIGCGLFGLEGSQAAMSADYAFGQFRFLTKLLLVHGRWSYQRVADMHSNFFYKNVIWTFAMFWFMFWNSFDATYLYEYTFILFYNLLFTSLPVIVMGAFDQDINARAALAFPQLYIRGIRGLEYTRPMFWSYMLDGLYQSAIVFFIPYFAWELGLAISWNGKGIDSLADFGTTVSVAAIFAANTFVGMNTNYWTVITWVTVFGSSFVMLLWIIIYSLFNSIDFNDEVVVLFGNITFWATVIISVVIALAPRYIYKFATMVYDPLDKHIVREMWVLGDLKDRLGLGHHKKPKANRVYQASASLEAAPMFTQSHSRSTSEVSNRYEPTRTGSPGVGMTMRQTFLNTPPLNETEPLAYPRGTWSGSNTPPHAHFKDGGVFDTKDLKNDVYYSSPGSSSPSLFPSLAYLAGGDRTGSSPSRRVSVKHYSSTSPTNPRSPTRSGSERATPGGSYSVDPESYEMRTRGTQSRQEQDLSASRKSFATAEDWPKSDDDGEQSMVEERSYHESQHRQYLDPNGGYRVHTGSEDVPPYESQEMYRHSRVPSNESWTGGRAL